MAEGTVEYPLSRSMRRKYTRYYSRRIEDSPAEAAEKAREIISKFALQVTPGGTYVGIGAGKGATEQPIAETSLGHLRLILLDIAKRKPVEPLRQKKIRGARIISVEADAHKLPLPDNSIELASCLMSQDFYDDRRQATIEAHRILKPGARLVLFLHHPSMFRVLTAQRRDAPALAPRTSREVIDFWSRLIREGRVFSRKEQIEDFYRTHGFQVKSITEHTPDPTVSEDKSNYWWEVILQKPAAKN